MTMNNRNMALSIMDSVRTCEVIFANGIDFNIDRLDPGMKRYTYAFDSARLDLKEGERVVIPGSGKYSVGTVVAVHEENQIDLSATYDYALVTDIVVIDDDIEKRLAEAVKLLNTAQRQDAKAKLLHQFTGNMNAEARTRLEAGFNELGITVSQKDE